MAKTVFRQVKYRFLVGGYNLRFINFLFAIVIEGFEV